MQAEIFQNIISERHTLSTDYLAEIKHIIAKYPYCQSAYLPLLKKYYAESHIDFEDTLKLSAVYFSDRSRIRKFLLEESKTISLPEAVKEKATITAEEKIAASIAAIDPLLDQLNSQILAEAVGFSLEHEIEKEIAKLPEIPVEKETEKWNDQNKDFYSWLEKPKDETPKLKYAHLIDKFLTDQPKIVPKKEFFSPVNMARKSVEEDEEIVSETLANLYAQQGHYTKALKAFHQLSLKFPKKNTYFSARIKEIEELKKHKK